MARIATVGRVMKFFVLGWWVNILELLFVGNRVSEVE